MKKLTCLFMWYLYANLKNNKHKNSPKNMVNDWKNGWLNECILPSEPLASRLSAHLNQ